MISSEELLKPISAEKPCGEDLSYDPALPELEILIKGKPETQFSAAEEPDWRELRDKCVELFGRSKDLRVATALSLAVLKTDGLPGFRESLAVLKGLLENYWDGVYPRLDPDDNNDPLQRVNIISALATPMGTFGDPMQFLERLRSAPLANSPQMGRFGLGDVEQSKTGAAGPDGKPAPSMAQVEAAFRDTSPEFLQSVGKAVADSIALVNEIDKYLTRTIGAEKAPNLELLVNELKSMQGCLNPYVGGAALPDGGNGAVGGTGANESTAAGPSGTFGVRIAPAGDIQSREDVVRMLEKICEYYKRAEPSSPVPKLLERAKRLAKMDFMEAISDLSPDAIGRMKDLFGIRDEG